MQPQSRARVSAAARAGLDRCDPRAASRRADVHVLGLHAKPLAARRRPAPRPSPAERRTLPTRLTGAGVDRDVRGKPNAQRSCAGLDRAWRRRRTRKRASPAKSHRDQARREDQARRRARADAPRRCSSSTAIPSRIAPITRCRKRSCATAAKPAGAILGFANMLLRLYRAGAAARRARRMGHAGGADLPARSISRLSERARIRRCAASSSSTCCRSSSRPAASSDAQSARATRPTIFSPPPSRRKRSAAGTVLVASGDRDTFQLASESDHHPLSRARRRDGAHRPGRGPRALRRRPAAGARTSSRCAAIRPTSCRVLRASARRARRRCCESTAASRKCSLPANFRLLRTSFGYFGRSRP